MNVVRYKRKLVGDEDERAVSPVIGVILMVAITVILAAVIAAFVLDIGDLDDSAPNAQFDWEHVDEDQVDLTHTSGDNIDTGELTITVSDSDDSDSADLSTDEFTAGDTLEIDSTEDEVMLNSDNLVEDNAFDSVGDPIEEVTVTWSGDGSSTIIAEYEP